MAEARREKKKTISLENISNFLSQVLLCSCSESLSVASASWKRVWFLLLPTPKPVYAPFNYSALQHK